MLTKEQILDVAQKLRREPVNVTGLGEPIFVREMTGREHDKFDAATFPVDPKSGQATFNNQDYRARLFVATVCNGDGDLLFADKDLPAVSQLSSRVLTSVCTVARRLNGLAGDSTESAAKNS